MTEFETDYLAHYGIKGQKWGVKNGPPYPLDESIKRERAEDYKKRRTLSDTELKRKIERYKLEKEFKSLTEEDIYEGETYTKNILKDIGKKAMTTIGVGAVLYGVKAVVSKKFDAAEFANALFKGGAGKK